MLLLKKMWFSSSLWQLWYIVTSGHQPDIQLAKSHHHPKVRRFFRLATASAPEWARHLQVPASPGHRGQWQKFGDPPRWQSPALWPWFFCHEDKPLRNYGHNLCKSIRSQVIMLYTFKKTWYIPIVCHLKHLKRPWTHHWQPWNKYGNIEPPQKMPKCVSRML